MMTPNTMYASEARLRIRSFFAEPGGAPPRSTFEVKMGRERSRARPVPSSPMLRCRRADPRTSERGAAWRYAAIACRWSLIARHKPVPDCGRACRRIAHERDLLDV